MRRMLKVLGLFSILAALNVATVCVFLSAIPARAGLQQPAPACLQGDINGDGNRTLADALKLLNFLFQEGEEPVACAEGEKIDFALEIETALARFMPRTDDRVYERVDVSLDDYDADDRFDILEVPDGRVFVLTHWDESGSMRVLRNDVDLKLEYQSAAFVGAFRAQEPIVYPFHAGDTLTILAGADRTFWYWGYWTDAEEEK